MLIGGLQKMTLIDFPGHISATIFTVGCNFRCHFCHNPELVLVEPEVKNTILHEDEVLNFLLARKNLLDGLCLTGGEPTMQKDLPEFLKKVKSFGYFIKLDTNGTNPEMLAKLIDQKLIDFVAMDIKAPWEKYNEVTNTVNDLEKIKKSVTILMQDKIKYEFRSTILPKLHSKDDILEMAKQIKGARAYYLQKFKISGKLVDQEYATEKAYTSKDVEELKEKIKNWFDYCEIR